MTPRIYHNPDCGTSRNVLAALRALTPQPEVIEYLKTPPDADTLARLIQSSGMSVRDVLRVKGTPYKELGLDSPHWTEAELLTHMLRHPILINRPLVVTDRGVRLCRPSDVVLDLVDVPDGVTLTKEEGVPFLRDAQVNPGDTDIPQPEADNARCYVYTSTQAQRMAQSGMSLCEGHALVHGLLVAQQDPRLDIARNALALLLRRAFEQGARQAWALPDGAQDQAFFEKAGFRQADISTLPEALHATAQQLAAEHTPLYTRAISL